MRGKIFVGFLFLLAACLNDETITPQQQLNKDVEKIDQYLAANGITDVIKDASGVRIKINSLGTAGLPPNSGSELEIDYVGKLLSNGTVFDDGTTFLPLNSYIDGWKIALPMLPEGTSATLYIPSVWGYGAGGSGSIPSNANLIFNITLVNVEPTPAQTAKLALDVAAIDLELSTINDVVVIHESGVRYVMTDEGTGIAPTLYSQVKISYKVLLLSDSSEFRNIELMPTATFSSRVANYPQGVMIGLQLMKEGGKATFFTPSILAFGPQTTTGLPANSNIIFEIELLDVIN